MNFLKNILWPDESDNAIDIGLYYMFDVNNRKRNVDNKLDMWPVYLRLQPISWDCETVILHNQRETW